MQGFVKSSEIRYSGFEKAAVLLAELGSASEKVLQALDLSDLEKNKLTKAMRNLGRYDANDISDVKREQAVLNEVLLYGAQKNILSKKPVVPAEERDKNKNMWQTVKKDPDKVANLLKLWLDEDKK